VKLPAHPRTKPSGVEWLGDVPEHWEVKRSDGMVDTEKRQVSPEAFADKEVFHYSIPAVQEFGTGLIENGDSIASAKQAVTEPVVLISRLNPRKATICRAEPKQQRTLASTEFVALKARKCDLTFLEYLVSTELFRQRLDSWVQSVTRSHQRASPELIYRFWSAWPDRTEQRTIAVFLDRETGRVDRLVAKKRELIERLKEERIALISRTVTRGLPLAAARAAGLPENPPLKHSGIDWIGDIPKHWDVVPYKRVCTRVDVGIAEAATHAYCDDGVPIIRSTNVKPNKLDTSDVLRIEPWFAQKNRSKTLRAGDLVTVRTGYPGTTAAVPREFDGCQCFTLVLSTPKRTAHGPFFSWVLNSNPGASYFEMEGWGTAQTNISVPIVRFMPVPRPPLPEQVAIAAYLDEETAKLDALVRKVEEAVERLQEYRTAVITAAVTGKIDVRNRPKMPYDIAIK
jgi:type I restriction enzyme S subunit